MSIEQVPVIDERRIDKDGCGHAPTQEDRSYDVEDLTHTIVEGKVKYA